MKAAIEHSRSGPEDEAASLAYDAALDTFEGLLEKAMVDNELWFKELSNGHEYPFGGIEIYMQAASMMTICFVNSVSRWSLAALTECMDVLSLTLFNCATLLSCGDRVLMESTKMWLLRFVPSSVDVDIPAELGSTAPLALDGALADATPLTTEPGESYVAQKVPSDSVGNGIGAPDVGTMSLKDIAKSIAQVSPHFYVVATAHMDQMKNIAIGVSRCFEFVGNRMGQEWVAGEAEVMKRGFEKAFEKNTIALERIMSYTSSFMELVVKVADEAEVSPAEAIDSSEDSNLCRFCKIHHESKHGFPLEFKPAKSEGEEAASQALNTMIGRFMGDCGQLVCEKLASATIAHNIRIVTGDGAVRIATVHQDVLLKSERHLRFPLIVSSPIGRRLVAHEPRLGQGGRGLVAVRHDGVQPRLGLHRDLLQRDQPRRLGDHWCSGPRRRANEVALGGRHVAASHHRQVHRRLHRRRLHPHSIGLPS